jgi:uncharacterized protein YceK
MSVRIAAVLAIVAAVAVSGCATIGTLSEEETKNKIYSGTIRHAELKCAHAVCLDFPFSLVADTFLLPISVPWSIVNFVRAGGSKAELDNPPTSTVRDARESGARSSR